MRIRRRRGCPRTGCRTCPRLRARTRGARPEVGDRADRGGVAFERHLDPDVRIAVEREEMIDDREVALRRPRGRALRARRSREVVEHPVRLRGRGLEVAEDLACAIRGAQTVGTSSRVGWTASVPRPKRVSSSPMMSGCACTIRPCPGPEVLRLLPLGRLRSRCDGAGGRSTPWGRRSSSGGVVRRPPPSGAARVPP